MSNRVWILFFALNMLFLVMKWYIFPTGEGHDFASYMATMCAVLTIVFGILNIMGYERDE